MKLKIGTELIDKDGDRAVVLDLDANISIMLSDGCVLKYTNQDVLLKEFTPTSYMYTEVLALISHMKVMEHMGKEGAREQS